MKLDNTRAALARYDAEMTVLNKELDSARTNAGVRAWVEKSQAAADRVREAFYLDTRETNHNSRSACMAAPISDLRDMVERSFTCAR